MITGVLLHPVPKNVGGWFPRTPSLPPSPFNLFSPPSLRFHRPVRSYQAVPTFFLSPCPFFFTPCIFIWSVVRPGNWKKKKKKKERDVMHCHLWASSYCFFLVTFLFHRHLALAALLPTRSSSSSEEPSSEAYSVAWSGPAPGDRFGSGDTIVGEWQVTPQSQKIVSPSFRLCMGGQDGCGATIWPEVVKESEGSYYVSLYVRHRLFFFFFLVSSRKKE